MLNYGDFFAARYVVLCNYLHPKEVNKALQRAQKKNERDSFPFLCHSSET